MNTGTDIYMKRALELALNGAANVSPNPMVGCVIVCKGEIIGEGWHEYFGGPHAEPNAIAKVKDQTLLPASTLYVTLEPCAHYGKTPPCAHLIIEKKIGKVVICNLDPNPLVAGKGVKLLQDAGIEVEIGVLEEEGYWLNRRFFTQITAHRPYIILKWAQTNDGFIARDNYDSKWISNTLSRKLVHKWRAEEDAILVGKNTAKHDNPMLTTREWEGKNPVRVVIDRRLELSNNLHLFDKSVMTICINDIKDENQEHLAYLKVDFDQNFAQNLMDVLNQYHIQSVIVEGGATTLHYFIQNELWDEARVFISPTIFGKGIKAPQITGVLHSETNIDTDQLFIYTKL